MKRVSLCIGVFLVLFLNIGVCTVQAQDLSGFNGQWLNTTLKMQNTWATDGSGTTTVPVKMKNTTEKFYACARAGGGSATLFLFNREGTFIPDLTIHVGWIAGTDDDFVANLNISIPGTTSTGFVREKDGKFQSINGYTVYSAPDAFVTYDIIFNGKILKKAPRYSEGVNCATFSP